MSEATVDSKAISKNTNGVFVSKAIHFLLFYLIVAILLISGIAKIIDPLPIIKSLEAFKLFSFTPFENELNILIATTLPIFEIGLALLLILKVKLKAALSLTFLLFSAFLIYAIYGYYLGITDDCGCFGDLIKSEFGMGMIIRNFGFVAITAYLSLYKNTTVVK